MAAYKINRGFITQKIKNKTTIFAGEKSILFTLNETASYLFTGIKLGWNREKLIEKLINVYNIAQDRAKKDVDEFISLLKKKKIIEE